MAHLYRKTLTGYRRSSSFPPPAQGSLASFLGLRELLLQGRVPIHLDSNTTVGERGGECMRTGAGMSGATLQVLSALLERPTDDHYGLDICRGTKLKGGTVYPILARLEAAGWVTSTWEDIDPKVEGRHARRNYRLTPSGWEFARQALED